MQKRSYIYTLALMLALLACNNGAKLQNNIAKIKVNVEIERFDDLMRKAKPKDLPKLKQSYPFLFSKEHSDSVWAYKLRDTLQHQLLNEVNKTFSNFNALKEEVTHLFQHLKYYDKTFNLPRVITLTNGVRYRSKTIVTDTLVLVALDNFLGATHEFYQNIPRYLTANMTKNQIVPSIAEAYAKKYTFQTQRSTLLDEMIYFGKLLYFKDVMLPNTSREDKIGYTSEQLRWAETNESPIWSYFIEQELLYSTSSKLMNRFIADAPFSKFYLKLDNQSPGRLGQYIGWQIVSAYAKTTAKAVFEILEASPQEILKKSKFKPKK